MQIDKPLLKSLLLMADIIEARDPYTGGHVWRVSQFAKLLSIKVGLSETEAIQISLGGYLHYLGKVGTPVSILRKPEKLSEQEFEIIKTHPLSAAR
jgi:HD-GYP domain-containing protein (c-di-GMP phosphodiesterase class II)